MRVTPKLDVKVGDEVTIIGRDHERIVKVDHVTPGGMIDAGGRRWNANGWERGEKATKWGSRTRIARTTQEHRNYFERAALTRECVKAFDAIGLLHTSEVIRMTSDDIREATRLIGELAPLLAKRKG